MRILVAEDEKGLNRVLTKHLKNKGYSVDSCTDGLEATDYLAAASYDVVILDVLMPKMNGWEVLKWIRSRGMDTSVLMLTALDSTEDKVRGLDSGADDYLTKPFALEELLARIRLLTRKRSGRRTLTWQIADLVMDCERHKVTRGGKEIVLSAKEFSMLEYFMAHPNIVLSRDTLLEHVWDYDYEGASNMIDVYIRHLRKKIDEGFEQKLIHTVRGRGYVLREDS
ncbi:MAG: response regulator transcription factor [Lachnospiraceae bacterium]|nr:response regulator transcription factor [Lachnospiraceae bacterium]